jgi:CubicO group peptidase (beta-lactamase class C family)
MSTGIPTVNFAIGRDDDAVKTLQRFAELIPNVPFPSNISQYSTIHWNAVAGVPDFVANISLSDFLETYIWGPAGIEAKINALEAKETGRRGQAFTLTWEDQAACTVALTNGSLYNATEACAAGAEIFDYWSNGTTLEQLGGGSVLMTGKDMVCTPILPLRVLASIRAAFCTRTG